MTPTTSVWSWAELTQAFGTTGAILLVCFAILSLCFWLGTPLMLFFLHAKTRMLAARVEDLQEQIAAVQRLQQVTRLRQDRQPRRRR
jgi:hypothetical protein